MTPAEPPPTISHYRVLSRLGAGGMGELFLALDETLQRRVVLKAIRSEQRLDPPATARFLREARVLSLLDHPGICRIHDYLHDDTGDFLVLELIEGEDLRGWVVRRRELPVVLRIAEQMVSALAAAHAAGIVHRDLKPANVMVTHAGQAKVLDFGLARAELETPSSSWSVEGGGAPHPAAASVAGSGAAGAADRDDHGIVERPPTDSTLTSPGTTLGTVRYMSPEQARGELVTSASDMFSFGIVLQELCTGRPAHPSDLPLDELLERARRGQVEPARGLRGDVEALIGRLLDQDQRQRPTASETLRLLHRVRTRGMRWLRRAAAAVLAIALVGAAVKYTVDLSGANAATLKEKGKAEDLVEFMLGDLHTKLETVGRLELIEDAVRKALDYYSAPTERDLSDADRMRRSRALVLIGKIGISRGGLAESLDLLQKMQVEQEEIVAGAPEIQEWRFELAQTRFWIGTVHFLQDDFAAAKTDFLAYHALAEELHAREPGVERWDVERAYALTNLAVLEDRSGEHDQARRRMEAAVAIKRSLASLHPADVDRCKDLLNGVAWLADLDYRRRDLGGALRQLEEELELVDRLLQRAPKDMEAKALKAVCQERLGEHLLQLGRLDEARAHWGDDLRNAEEMVALDPENADWVEGLAVSRLNCARLQMIGGDPDGARKLALGSRELFLELQGRDAARKDWLLGLVSGGALLADIELRCDAPARGRALCDEYLAKIRGPEASVASEPRAALLTAKLWYVRGRCSGALSDDGANADFTRARTAVAGAEAPEMTFDRLDLEFRVLAALGEREAAHAVAERLRAMGYREPEFELVSRQYDH